MNATIPRTRGKPYFQSNARPRIKKFAHYCFIHLLCLSTTRFSDGADRLPSTKISQREARNAKFANIFEKSGSKYDGRFNYTAKGRFKSPYVHCICRNGASQLLHLLQIRSIKKARFVMIFNYTVQVYFGRAQLRAILCRNIVLNSALGIFAKPPSSSLAFLPANHLGFYEVVRLMMLSPVRATETFYIKLFLT